MRLETLNRGIIIKESIDSFRKQKGELVALYRKKEKLSYDDIEKLFAIALSGNEYRIEHLEDLLNKL